MTQPSRPIVHDRSQQPRQTRCVGPTNPFIEFKKEEIEQSIPERFDQIVAAHSGRLAVKTNRAELTYDELNRTANRVAHALLARHGPGSCG